ncbi:hypothetical protein Pelo_18188 [Pelomyxa schiedti]|nr:hypothetical protein Pelo_18188 [Pelomyxa schiedti]
MPPNGIISPMDPVYHQEISTLPRPSHNPLAVGDASIQPTKKSPLFGVAATLPSASSSAAAPGLGQQKAYTLDGTGFLGEYIDGPYTCHRHAQRDGDERAPPAAVRPEPGRDDEGLRAADDAAKRSRHMESIRGELDAARRAGLPAPQ